jgi:hypothetical protein
MDQIINKLTDWAENEPSILAMILEGSRGGGGKPDEFSDYDINVFFSGENKFILKDDWLEQFDHVLVFQKEKFNFQGTIIQSRLVLFRNIPRIDFPFWPVRLMHELIVKGPPESYKNGNLVLIDKEGLCQKLPASSGDGFNLVKPGKIQFLETVYKFWFEMMASVKYLQRGSLWFVNSVYDGPVRRYLLQMILWKEGCDQGWSRNRKIHLPTN